MSLDRTAFDPEARYPAEGSRLVERNAERVMALMPFGLQSRIERTRDAIQIDIGDDERGIVVLVTPEAFDIRLPTVEWTCGAYGPAASSRLWRRVKSANLSDEGLRDLLQKAVAKFKKCRHCGQFFPAEHRHDRVCHGCAERDQGIVY